MTVRAADDEGEFRRGAIPEVTELIGEGFAVDRLAALVEDDADTAVLAASDQPRCLVGFNAAMLRSRCCSS